MFKTEIDKEIRLELISQSHIKEFLALFEKNSEHIGRWVNYPKENTLEYLEKSIESSLVSYQKNRILSCVVFYNNKIVGFISIWGMGSNPKMIRKGELTYWLDKEHQNMGIMRRAIEKIIELGFTRYELDKIVVRVAIGNDRSMNIPIKLGFHLDGVLRRDMKVNEKFQDLNIYSLLREEYKGEKYESFKNIC